MDHYEVHPAAELFPLLEGKAYEEFREDIREQGQTEPIAVWRGMLLDGRNRLRACRDLNIMPLVHRLRDDIDPIRYVVSQNLMRRHLNESQRAVLGARLKEHLMKEARERQVEGNRKGGKTAGKGRPKVVDSSVQNSAPSYDDTKSRDKAAELVNVSHYSIDAAGKVVAEGTPGLVAMVESGKVAVSAAAAVATLPKEEQTAAVEAGPGVVKQAAKAVRDRKRKATGAATAAAPPGVSRGKGVALAHEAINVLQRIPRNDGLRAEGFDMVLRWVRHNR